MFITLIESRRQILLIAVSCSINVKMFTGHAAAHKEEQEIRADDAEKKEPPGTNPYVREDPPRKERGMSCFRIFHDAGLYGMCSLDASQNAHFCWSNYKDIQGPKPTDLASLLVVVQMSGEFSPISQLKQTWNHDSFCNTDRSDTT